MRTQYEQRLSRLEELVERRHGEISEAHREELEQELRRLQALRARLEQGEAAGLRRPGEDQE
jgi:DNA repair exonuclease SbcCD ATPase subunit